MAEAHAKMHLRDYVNDDDIDTGLGLALITLCIRVYVYCMYMTGVLSRSVISYKLYYKSQFTSTNKYLKCPFLE